MTEQTHMILYFFIQLGEIKKKYKIMYLDVS